MALYCRCVASRNFRQLPNATVFVRSKHKLHKAPRKQEEPKHRALAQFDGMYKEFFKKDWESIREALLKNQKYVVLLNNYGDVEASIADFENRGAINMRRLFQLRKEYISEQYDQNKKVPYLENIWKGEKQATQKGNKEKQAEVEEEKKLSDLSLESSLKRADIDESRIIDADSDLSFNLMNQYMPATQIKGREDWVEESTYYFEDGEEMPFQVVKEFDINFPEHLNIFCYEASNYTNFFSPKRGVTKVYNYYVMDGASVMPVLALDIRPGNNVLDMCAAPGGKSLVALQTLYPNSVVLNDISYMRIRRIWDVLHEYFYDLKERFINTNKIQVTHFDARFYEGDHFDRILVDVPCTNDRLSVTDNENNIFIGSKVKDRLKLPEIQCDLLVRALHLIKEGGIIVYSTCSLSPIQNDGVVFMALKRIARENNKKKFIVKDMSAALAQVSDVYYLANKRIMRCGSLIVPNVKQNYGPMYFSKIVRIK